jgi:hypothetical protein
MNKLIWIVVIIVFVFLLTYDPKSGRLEKYITTPQVARVAPPSLTLNKCSEDRYYELQFNEKAPPGTCAGTPKEVLGAVIQA